MCTGTQPEAPFHGGVYPGGVYPGGAFAGLANLEGRPSKLPHPPYPAYLQAYLNGVDVPYIFHLNTLVAKVLGAIGSVAGGLAIGKEGPFVHAGAAIAAIVSQVSLFSRKGARQLYENVRGKMEARGGRGGGGDKSHTASDI